jgi:hypothetical protein
MTTTNSEKAVLFIGANRPIIGREKEATSFLLETGGWLENQKAMGWCTRWDAFWLTAHGGDMNSAFVCYGSRAKLDEWRRTDAFEAWVFRAMSLLDGFGVIPGVTFSAAKETLERRAKAIGY